LKPARLACQPGEYPKAYQHSPLFPHLPERCCRQAICSRARPASGSPFRLRVPPRRRLPRHQRRQSLTSIRADTPGGWHPRHAVAAAAGSPRQPQPSPDRGRAPVHPPGSAAIGRARRSASHRQAGRPHHAVRHGSFPRPLPAQRREVSPRQDRPFASEEVLGKARRIELASARPGRHHLGQSRQRPRIELPLGPCPHRAWERCDRTVGNGGDALAKTIRPDESSVVGISVPGGSAVAEPPMLLSPLILPTQRRPQAFKLIYLT